jgi:hypothetical protein
MLRLRPPPYYTLLPIALLFSFSFPLLLLLLLLLPANTALRERGEEF